MTVRVPVLNALKPSPVPPHAALAQWLVTARQAAHQPAAQARMPLVADSLASGDLVEVLPGGRIDTPMVYWLLVGARNSSRPEIQAFCDWLLAQAAITRQATGEDPHTASQALAR